MVEHGEPETHHGIIILSDYPAAVIYKLTLRKKPAHAQPTINVTRRYAARALQNLSSLNGGRAAW